MNTENHEIPVKSPVLLRFTVQMPATEKNIASMENLKARALMMEWDEVAPFSVIKQEAPCISSAYVAERPAPPEPKPVEWHNPDNLTPEQLGEGFRFLAVGEGVPQGAQVYQPQMQGVSWTRSYRDLGSPPAAGFTYRTNLPYPYPAPV